MTVAAASAIGPGSEQAYFDTAPELLSAISEALDVRSVFPRVSRIANALLPHDALLLALVGGDGKLVVHATTGDWPDGGGGVTGLPLLEPPIVGDLRTEPLPPDCEDRRRRVLDAGYRALMSVDAWAREQRLALQFWSRRPHAFDRDGLPLARRIAHHMPIEEILAKGAGTAERARARGDPQRQGAPIASEHLALSSAGPTPSGVCSDLGTVECATISRVMRECRGNKPSAARRLGLSRTQLYSRLRKYGIADPPTL
jgi:hypothetical protein